MPLHLHEHNQRMLEQVEAILDVHDRCCIEQATGCGKSFVVHAWLQNHPNTRTLIIVPHAYIASDQRHKIRQDDPLYDFSSIRTMTYAKLLTDYKNDALPEDLQCIIFDEMHHVGADQWGQAAFALVELNPDAKVIGTTATPVRTDGRDMARALFTEDERTIPYTFVQALYDGVLPSPSYIVGTYELVERVQKIGDEIKRCGNPELKKLLEEEYDVLRGRVADSAVNVDDLIAEHLTALNPHPKVIVFCPTITQMEKAANNIPGWFRENAGDMRIWTVSSKNPASVNEERLRQFSEDDDDSITRVICSVDCIGEGVHVSGVDAVIMMRTTKSTNVYIQQMGRCLESGSKRTPVIFDLVDNLSSIGNPQFIKQEVRRTVRELCKSGEWSGRFEALSREGLTKSEIIDRIVEDTINNFGPSMSASQGDVLNACAQQAQNDAKQYGRNGTAADVDDDAQETPSETADDDFNVDMDYDDEIANPVVEAAMKRSLRDIFDKGLDEANKKLAQTATNDLKNGSGKDDTDASDRTSDADDIPKTDDGKPPYFDDSRVPRDKHSRGRGTTMPKDTVRRQRRADTTPPRLFKVIDRSVSIRELLDKLEDALAKNERANKAIVALCRHYIAKLMNDEAVEPFDGWFETAYAYCLQFGVDLKSDKD